MVCAKKESQGISAEDALPDGGESGCRSGVKREQGTLDRYIEEASENWKISRITYVDKNIMRVAIFEMLYSPEVPPKVAIDEALELAKKFGSEDSKDFVNGVLDRILKDHYGRVDHKDG
jgi:N utilization substance protein B